MDPDDIHDEKSLKAWLTARPEAVRQRDGAWIALRSAARIYPIALQWAALSDQTYLEPAIGLSVTALRRALISGSVAVASPSETTRRAAALSGYMVSNLASKRRAPSLQATARASQVMASRVVSSPDVIGLTASVLHSARKSIASSQGEDLWRALRADATSLAKGDSLFQVPLWTSVPDWFVTAELGAERALDSMVQDISNFWRRWWTGLCTGNQLDLGLQRLVALIPESIWREGEVAITREISKFESVNALEITENGEEVYVDPVAGRLGLRATVRLPETIEARMRRVLRGLSRLFGDEASNQHRALAPDLRMLAEMAEDEGASAVEIFDTFASASRRLRNRVANGECPSAEQDALVEDYGLRITNAAADLLSESQEVQAVLSRRNGLKGNTALQDGRSDILAAIELVRPALLQSFVVKLDTDLNVASNASADPEEKRDAGFRLSGRMLRIGVLASAVVGAPVAAVITTSDFLTALHSIAADPLYQAALQWIMRWLGH